MKIVILLDKNRKAIYESKMPAFNKEVFDLYTITPKGVKKSKITLINNNGTWEEPKKQYYYNPEPMKYGRDSKFKSIGEGLYRAKTIWFE